MINHELLRKSLTTLLVVTAQLSTVEIFAETSQQSEQAVAAAKARADAQAQAYAQAQADAKARADAKETAESLAQVAEQKDKEAEADLFRQATKEVLEETALQQGDLDRARSYLDSIEEILISPESNEPCRTEDEGTGTEPACSQRLMDSAERIEDMTDQAATAAMQGRVNEFRSILNELDRTAASALPSDVGWGRHSSFQEKDELTMKLSECLGEVEMLVENLSDSLNMQTVADLRVAQEENCRRDFRQPVAGARDSDYFLGIYAGLEGTTLDELNSADATARVGFTLYNQLLRFRTSNKDGDLKLVKWLSRSECEVTSECGFGIGFHSYINVLLTSSAEQSVLTIDDNTTGMMPLVLDGVDMDLANPVTSGDTEDEGSEDAPIRSAVEVELGTFLPVYKKHRTRFGELLAGPIAHTSVSRFDGSETFVKRYYGGFRFAYSPEAWIDLTYGKTEGLDGRRAEVRFQIPVFNISPDSRLLVGAIANVGVRNTDDEDRDSFRLFVSWNTGFRNLFTSN